MRVPGFRQLSGCRGAEQAGDQLGVRPADRH
jgi:hypothetical protein